MASDEHGTITRVLNGDAGPDANAIHARVYDELRAIASRHLLREGDARGLQTTVLVHEAWLKLAQGQWDSRAHFFASASRAMRQILVDEARRRRARRGHAGVRTDSTIVAPGDPDPVEIIALDDALRDLEQHDQRAAAVVTLRFFGGLDMPAVAETLGVSLRTAEREWTHARAWLLEQLNGQE